MLRVLLRVFADTALVATVLFATARTFAWPRAWALLAVLVVVRTLTAVAVFRVNPALLKERATVLVHRGQPMADRLLLLAYMAAAFIGVPFVAALDVFHWHLLPAPPLAIAAMGLVSFTAGWVITAVALRKNAFAVTVIRLQDERQHTLVDTGIYGVLRHPMYAGSPLVLLGQSLWLGSCAAAVYAVIPLALLVVRIGLEERFLRRTLPGYAEYTSRVRYRVVPGVW